MRIERSHHAAYGLVHQRMIIDVIDILALDALEDFRELTCLFPWKRRGNTVSFRRLARTFRKNSAGRRCGETEHSSRTESDQRTRPRRDHALQTPRFE